MKVHVVVVVSLMSLHVCGSSTEEINWNNNESGLEETNSASNTTKLLRVVPIMFSRVSHYNDSVIACTKSSEEFPQFFTEEQRKNGAVILSFVIAAYCFTIIAIICDSYFLPCVERICESLNLSQDVAAATFMSVATSTPELFVNIIGTFITESDIGIGTVVGSSMFNTLGVASIGGLAATAPIKLDWWPLTRDTFIYILAIALLVSISWDGEIHWYEALLLFSAYFLYFMIMFQNVRISKFFRKLVRKCTKKVSTEPFKTNSELSSVSCIETTVKKFEETKEDYSKQSGKQEEDTISVFQFPHEEHWTKKFIFIYVWPIKFLLFCTIPDCKKHKKFYPLTFIMCMLWIATNSYIVSWMITVIGGTLGIEDFVLGLTFLAAGGCLPEAISISITSRKGEGAMGVSNALGANTMNILLSLGLPWFLKTAIGGDTIKIVSGSLEYTVIGLIVVALILYITLLANKFRLSRFSGTILIIFYGLSVALAILAEVLFFEVVQCSDIT